MAKNKYTNQVSNPLHIENTVNSLQREDLKLPKAFNTYREMLEDPYIGAGVGLTQNLINKLNYSLVADKDATAEEQKLVDALNKSLTNLNGMTKQDFLNYALICRFTFRF